MLDSTVCTPFEYDNSLFIWLTYTAESGQVWYVTSNRMRTEYYLFKGKKQTAKKSTNPLDLYKYIKD